MADTTTDPDLMEVDDSSGSIPMEKNEISDDENKVAKSPSDIVEAMEEDSLGNSNLDPDDAITNESEAKEVAITNESEAKEGAITNDSEAKEDLITNVPEAKEDVITVELEANSSVGPADTTANEPEVSTNKGLQLVENNKESEEDNAADNEATPTEIEAPVLSSIPTEKQLSSVSETDSPKPSALQEILTETCPKNSPEVIIANLSPFVKDRFEMGDSSKAKPEKENGAKVDLTDNTEETESKETETKEKSKSGKKKKNKICDGCDMKKKLPLKIVFHGQIYHLCSEDCYKNFKQKTVPVSKLINDNCGQCQVKIDNKPAFFPCVGEVKALCSEGCVLRYQEENSKPINCSHCKQSVVGAYNRLIWETMVFCNDDCLCKYQSLSGSHCTCCQSPVQQTSLGKYCVCFGTDIRQFCSGSCLEDFKKGLKVCSFCQTDLSAGGEGFLAPVGDRGQFKDFCTQQCMERYEVMNNLTKNVPVPNYCCNCKKFGVFKSQVKQGDKTLYICSDMCLAAYRCSYQIMDNLCCNCFKCFKPNENETFSLIFEGNPKQFCTKACRSLFVLSNRKIIQCLFCKVKKYNFDMIEKMDTNNKIQMFCSLNCFSIFRANSNTNNKWGCYYCNKNCLTTYHLNQPDGVIRSFCHIDCVQAFQNQEANSGSSADTSNTPIIANVVSLAPNRSGMSPLGQTKSRLPQYLVPMGQGVNQVIIPPPGNNVPNRTSSSIASTSTSNQSMGNAACNREIVVRPPPPKSLRNKSASCRPITINKGVSAKSQTSNKAVQTGAECIDHRKNLTKHRRKSNIGRRSLGARGARQKRLRKSFELQNARIEEQRQRNAKMRALNNEELRVEKYEDVGLHKQQSTDVKYPDDTRMPSILPVPFPVYLPSPVVVTKTISIPMPFPVPVPIPVPIFINKDKSSTDLHDSCLSRMASTSAECIRIIEESKEQLSKQLTNIEEGNEAVISNSQETSLAAITENEAQNIQQTDVAETTIEQTTENNKQAADKPNGVQVDGQASIQENEVQDNTVPKIEPVDENVPPECAKRRRKKRSGEDLIISEGKRSRPDDDHDLNYFVGVRAWKEWIAKKNDFMQRNFENYEPYKEDILQLTNAEVSKTLSEFVKEILSPHQRLYTSGSIYYMVLGIQMYFNEHGRTEDIFSDKDFDLFANHFHDVLLQYHGRTMVHSLNVEGGVVPMGRVLELHLWQAKQLGAQSPQILLNTLMYYNAMHFHLKTAASQQSLKFGHIARHTDEQGSFLRYYKEKDNEKGKFDRKDLGRGDHWIIPENINDQMRCPVRLFEFYISKCPQDLLTWDSPFYLAPDPNCTPDSPIWYITEPLNRSTLMKAVYRHKIVEEMYFAVGD